MPAFKNHNASSGVPNTMGPHIGRQFAEVPPIFEELNVTLVGVTKDAAGAALGACRVLLFQTADNVLAGETLSDGSGNYSFTMSRMAGPFFVVSYQAGSPDVAGTTVNTLQGA